MPHDAYILWVNATFAAKTVADLKPPSSLTARVGTTGSGATNLVFTQISKEVLGLNVQNVRGYRGAANAFLAQQRGEIDGQVVGLSVRQGRTTGALPGRLPAPADRIRPHDPFSRLSRCPDRARTGQQTPKRRPSWPLRRRPSSWHCRSWRPPDLPPDRARALQDAFMAMTRDPAFIEEANRMNLERSPIDGEAVRRIIAQMSETPKDVIAQFNDDRRRQALTTWRGAIAARSTLRDTSGLSHIAVARLQLASRLPGVSAALVALPECS